MDIPTEPIGSIPRPPALLEASSAFGEGAAFAKIRARALGTALAAEALGGR
jgi:methionine synthase II (cobalamin-independent)